MQRDQNRVIAGNDHGRVPCASPVRWGLIADRSEEVDQVAVGIAEQHRANAPRLDRRFHHELADEGGEPLALAIDVFDLEIENGRPIGSRHGGAGAISLQRLLTGDGEIADGQIEFEIALVAGAGNAGDLLIESRERRYIVGHQSELLQFHGDIFPLVYNATLLYRITSEPVKPTGACLQSNRRDSG